MKLVHEIREKFSHLSLSDNTFYKLESLSADARAWVLRIEGEYAVGIEIAKEQKVNESFSSVSYYTQGFHVDGTEKNLLVLSNSAVHLRSEFAGIAAMFLEPGGKNIKRNELLDHPHKWWESWKDLLGNKNIDSTVHGIVGELIFLYYLREVFGDSITIESWTGPTGGSQDFLFKDRTFEVKSTLVKYNDVVNISGQFQLDQEQLSNLIFVRLEEVLPNSTLKGTVSIDRILNLLVEQGFEYEQLNEHVNRVGFMENSIDRSSTFKILEVRKYEVNEDFPAINVNNITNAQNILQVNYKISLAGLEYESLNDKLSDVIKTNN